MLLWCRARSQGLPEGLTASWRGAGAAGGAPRRALIYLAGCFPWTHLRPGNRERVQRSGPPRAWSAAPGRLAGRQLRGVLEEYGFSWFSQNEEAPQSPLRNYFEKLMQTFEGKEGRKQRRKNIDVYALYMTIWSLVEKSVRGRLDFSLSSPREAVLVAKGVPRGAETTRVGVI